MDAPETVEQDLPTIDPARGLTAADVAERIAAGRTNAFTADSSRSVWSIVRTNVFTLFNGIVGACFLVLLLVGRWQDALFGLSALANAVIGCYQEFKAKAALDRLALLNAPRARVRRDGAEAEISPADVVQDDILILRAGDQVPADAVVVTSRALQIDESMLTGESDAVDKKRGDEALSGSVVVAGEGDAQVSRVGADSYANRFAAEAKRFSLVSSELRTSINRVLTWVGWTIGPVGILVLNAQMQVAGGWVHAVESGQWQQPVVNTVASLTAMIPLGLVLMTSIAFAVGAAKLASRQVLVNELPAVEGLARVDVICLDKTGTLTAGEIAFDAVHPIDESIAGWDAVLAWFGAAPDANATARVLAGPYPVRHPATALAYIPFSSARKWSAVSLDEPGGTWVMGAPEMVFGDVAADTSTTLGSTVVELASTGRRTLVIAHIDERLTDADVEAERMPGPPRPVLVVTFREQVRPDARQTLEYFREQGVGVRVISGDNPRTVASIAREVGLDAPEGYDARKLPDDDAALADVLEQHTVYGRVTPDQKRRMVVALQSRGHTVAMTGDGVNDALAIKTADIGIAMNSGAAATKAVARLVLLDGQFSHLPDVVAEGRQVIANIERVSMLFLTKTVYATALAVTFGILLLEFPFLPRQLSITDGLTIGIPAFFLALMPNAQRYVPGFLKRSLSFAVPAGLVVALALTAYTLAAKGLDVDEDALRTGSTVMLAVVGIWILSVLCRPINRYKGAVVGAMFIGLVGLFSIPLAREFFVLTDPGQEAAVELALLTIGAILLIEVVRFFHRRFVARSLVDPAKAAERAREHVQRPVTVTVAMVLVFLGALGSVLLGLLVLLARYDTTEVLAVSLFGSAIVLFGLLLMAAAVALTRGSGLSRLFVTILTAILIVLQALSLVIGHDWSWTAAVQLLLFGYVLVTLWTPPGSRFFRPVREAGR